jgi:4-hydroxybenzoate polyprenyltransferase
MTENQLMNIPLCVDLDGTLIHTDMLHEMTIGLAIEQPAAALQIPVLLAQGKAKLKAFISARLDPDPGLLPYNENFLAWLREQAAVGRKLVLCTASDERVARSIAAYLGIFDEVLASDGNTNLAGAAKADLLAARYGERAYDYAGNSSTDLAVWRRARKAIVVNGASGLDRQAGEHCEVERVFPARKAGLSGWRRMLRLHQWLKNVLLFVPLLAAHNLSDGAAWQRLIIAFLAFSLCASSVYIANDLLDLGSDRLHPRKRLRPFAAGLVPVWWGAVLAPLLCGLSMVLAAGVSTGFLLLLLAYFVLTCAYSLGLKRVVLIDCLTLAILYTLRIVAGGAAALLPISLWLLAFSVFLFLSLSFVKRFAELQVQFKQGSEKVHGRGYYTSDAPVVQALGVASGFASALVLALYLNSDAVLRLYPSPQWVWGTVPVLVFWVSWVWLQAHRGEMHDDPVIFAVKDRTSLLAGLAFAVTLAMGAIRW